MSNALKFLSIVADRNHYRKLFEDSTVLASICENVIIPNMDFRGEYSFTFRMYLLLIFSVELICIQNTNWLFAFYYIIRRDCQQGVYKEIKTRSGWLSSN